MVPYCVLWDHDFEHLLGFRVRQLVLIDESGNVGVKGMDTFIGELVHIQEEFVSEVLEVVFWLDCGLSGI